MVTLEQTDNLEDTMQKTAYVNPPHTNTTRIPIGTPWDVRLGLTILPARYILRGLISTWTNQEAPEWFQKAAGLHFVEDWRSKPIIDKLNSLYAEYNTTIQELFADPLSQTRPTNEIFNILESKEGGKALLEANRKLHADYSMNDKFARNSMKYAVRGHARNGFRLTDESMKRIRDAATKDLFELVYDNALGLGSLAMSLHIRRNVLSDMKSVYSEAVSYELDRDPASITKDDIFNSSNQIIQSTASNFKRNQLRRLGISAIPFVKNFKPLRFTTFGDIAVGAWGALWAFDIWGREPTMLENFVSFINAKLNPLYGIGDPIQPKEIIDIYQHYAYRFAPETAFRSLSTNDEDANLMWAQSEKVFVRIAQLMNESYNYKHTTQLDPETNTPISSADFTLPKLIYLLGHGLINARRPEWSMAFVEIANSYGMKEVKEVEAAYKSDAKISDVLAKYPVDLNPNGHINGISRQIVIPGFTRTQSQRAQHNHTSGTESAEPSEHVSTKPNTAINLSATMPEQSKLQPATSAAVARNQT